MFSLITKIFSLFSDPFSIKSKSVFAIAKNLSDIATIIFHNNNKNLIFANRNAEALFFLQNN